MGSYHKPVRRPGDVIEVLSGSGDPADVAALAHDTAHALLSRVRGSSDPQLVEAVIAYADEHGIDDVAELWSGAEADTLPGALWRLYLLRFTVADNPAGAGYRFRSGLMLDTVGQALAGAGNMPTPEEVVDLATEILRGAFSGDFDVALDRASGFARVLAVGSNELAGSDSADSESETRLATGLAKMSQELAEAARLCRADRLD